MKDLLLVPNPFGPVQTSGPAAGSPGAEVCGAPVSSHCIHTPWVGLLNGKFKHISSTQSQTNLKNINWLIWASNLTQMYTEGFANFSEPDSTFQFVKKPRQEGLYSYQRCARYLVYGSALLIKAVPPHVEGTNPLCLRSPQMFVCATNPFVRLCLDSLKLIHDEQSFRYFSETND